MCPNCSKAEPYFGQSAGHIGGQYKKARFQEYGDIAFLSRKSSNDTSLGILGPVLRAEAGDDINIVIKNKGSRPFSFTGHGLTYTQGPGEMTGIDVIMLSLHTTQVKLQA